MTEAEFEGYDILLVAHGDPLQIFQTILHASFHSHSSEKNGILDANPVDICVKIKLTENNCSASNVQ
jgi:hypothetical protein